MKYKFHFPLYYKAKKDLQTNKITEDNGAFEKKLSKCRKIVDKIQEKWYNLSMSCKGYFTNAQP